MLGEVLYAGRAISAASLGAHPDRPGPPRLRPSNTPAGDGRSGFRMLEAHEISAAIAFPEGYVPSRLT